MNAKYLGAVLGLTIVSGCGSATNGSSSAADSGDESTSSSTSATGSSASGTSADSASSSSANSSMSGIDGGETGNEDGGTDAGPLDLTFVSMGSDNSVCAIASGGGAVCWGDAINGEFGFNPVPVPALVMGLASGITGVSVGQISACAIASGGGVVCWGDNSDGELGNGSTTTSAVPVQVTGLTAGVTFVSVGDLSACAVGSGGAIQCWGDNTGNTSTPSSSVPVPVMGLASGAIAVSAGTVACAIASGGAVECWGSNSLGQLGNGTTTDSAVPVQVTGLTSGATSVSVGGAVACAVVAGGVQCWGSNEYGQLGNGSTTDDVAVSPVQVTGLSTGVTTVSVSALSACALTTGGAVQCWGENPYGQLGNGTTTSSTVPMPVTGLPSGVTDLATGGESACALKADGSVWCWGTNGSGQLGNGTTTNSPVPVQIL